MINVVHATDPHFASEQGIFATDEADFFVEAALGMASVSLASAAVPQTIDRILYKRHDLLLTRIVLDYYHTLMAQAHGSIISGDLATRGLRPDLVVAANHITRKSVPGKGNLTDLHNPTFNTSNRPIILMPGNHDRFRDIYCNPGGEQFDSVFGSHWTSGPGGVQATPLYGTKGEEIFFLSADLCLFEARDSEPPGFSASAGQGRCYIDTIRRLEIACASLRKASPKAGIVLCMHFPPYDILDPACQTIDPLLKLIGFEVIIEIADRWDISCILAGHLHQTKVFPFGNILVLACGSATIYDAKNRNWMHEYSFNLRVGPKGMTEAFLERARLHHLNYDSWQFDVRSTDQWIK